MLIPFNSHSPKRRCAGCGGSGGGGGGGGVRCDHDATMNWKLQLHLLLKYYYIIMTNVLNMVWLLTNIKDFPGNWCGISWQIAPIWGNAKLKMKRMSETSCRNSSTLRIAMWQPNYASLGNGKVLFSIRKFIYLPCLVDYVTKFLFAIALMRCHMQNITGVLQYHFIPFHRIYGEWIRRSLTKCQNNFVSSILMHLINIELINIDIKWIVIEWR